MDDQRTIAATGNAPLRSPDSPGNTLPVAGSVRSKRRCRMPGGAPGSGAPRGKRNGNYRYGFYTAEAVATRRALRALIRELAD
jgi:hypothetical protein